MTENQSGSAQRPPVDQEVRGFFAKEDRILNDIAGGSVFTFRRGKKWAIDSEKGEATYDPKFFEEKGYTPSQALIGAFHEIRSHLVETAEIMDRRGGDVAWQRLKSRVEKTPWLHMWENHRTDIKGNRAIASFAPSLTQEMRRLYREKLWPETDFTDRSKHVQFMYAVLRQAMVPNEPVVIDPEVQEAIDKLRNVQGKDVIELATNPNQDPLIALRLSQKYIEPVIAELYKQDIEEKKRESQSEDGESQGEPSDSSGQQEKQGEGNPFEEDYEDYESRHPEPFEEDEKEIEEKIKETVKSQNPTSRKRIGYEQEHGVTHQEAASYYQEYRQVEEYIDPLREIFRKIVEQRSVPVEHLESLKEEGIMVDPGLIVQTQIESQVGVEQPRTMMDFEGKFVDENVPGKFSLRLVADLSRSMNGEKATQQRRSAILVMESLEEFSEMLNEEQLAVDLDVQTELRSFGNDTTTLLKPLSKELSERQRIDYFKKLLEIGGGTNDYDALIAIEQDVKTRIATDQLYASDLISGKKREIVIVLSDGDSNQIPVTQQRISALRKLGVKVVGLGMTQEAQGILTTYSPDGKICNNVSELPNMLQDMLKEYLGILFIK
jgi:hypothetical protein